MLGLAAMAQAVPELGKTFDHIAFGLAGAALWSFVTVRPGSANGSIPRLIGHRRSR